MVAVELHSALEFFGIGMARQACHDPAPELLSALAVFLVELRVMPEGKEIGQQNHRFQQ